MKAKVFVQKSKHCTLEFFINTQTHLLKVKLEIKDYLRITFKCYVVLLDWLIFNGRAETKLVMLAFLYCGELVKKSTATGYNTQFKYKV